MIIGRRLLNMSFVILLVSTLCFSVPGTRADTLPATAEDITPLATGDNAPKFSVQTVDGAPFNFDPSELRNPVVVISFRGGWCPYCNMHLSELRTVIPDIREMGFDVLFISNDRPEILYSGLKDETQEDIDGLDYVILSDAQLNAANAFGTAFRIPESLIPNLDRKKRDYAGSSIEHFDALAVPSVYVVNTDGQIVYDYVNPNYKVRLSAGELLQAAQRIHTE